MISFVNFIYKSAQFFSFNFCRRNNNESADWDRLPLVPLKLIYSYLDNPSFLNASRVCKTWRAAAFAADTPCLVDIRTAAEYAGLPDWEKREASRRLQMVADLIGGWKKMAALPRWSERVKTWPHLVLGGRETSIPLSISTLKPSDLPTPIVIGETATGTPLILFRHIHLINRQPGVCSLKKLKYNSGWSLTQGSDDHKQISEEFFLQSIQQLKSIFANPPATLESLSDPAFVEHVIVPQMQTHFPFLLWNGPDTL